MKPHDPFQGVGFTGSVLFGAGSRLRRREAASPVRPAIHKDPGTICTSMLENVNHALSRTLPLQALLKPVGSPATHEIMLTPLKETLPNPLELPSIHVLAQHVDLLIEVASKAEDQPHRQPVQEEG